MFPDDYLLDSGKMVITMKKIFRKYTILIMTFATIAILSVNGFLGAENLREQYAKEFTNKIDQIISLIHKNASEEESVEADRNAEYLTRIKAARYVIENNAQELNVENMGNLAKTMDIAELYVVDDQGTIIHSTSEIGLGVQLANEKMSSIFLNLYNDYNPQGYLIQDVMKSTSGYAMMCYVAICREDTVGMILAGFAEKSNSEKRNLYSVIFEQFPVGKEEEYFAIDKESGKLLGCSKGADTTAYRNSSGLVEKYASCKEGAFIQNGNNEPCYCVTKEYDDVIVGISIPRHELYQNLIWSMVTTLIYLSVIEGIILILLNSMINRVIIRGMHHILKDMDEIKNGNLNILVDEHATPEFETLSQGINRMVEGMRYENNHDHLTGLCRYAYFKTKAAEQKEHMEPGEVFAVFMMDLDHFKQVNDSYGHDAGDRYLAGFASVMKSMNPKHTLPCRRSGDEFCMAIFGLHSREEVEAYIKEFEEKVRGNVLRIADGVEKTVAFSGGYRVISEENISLAEMMKQADDALYQVKKNQRGMVKSFISLQEESGCKKEGFRV